MCKIRIYITPFLAVLLVIIFSSIATAQTRAENMQPDSMLQVAVERQDQRLDRIDSLLGTQQHLREIAQQDIQHAQSLVGAMETLVEFIALLIAILSIVGVIEIRKIHQIRQGLIEEMKQLKTERENISGGFATLKESFVKEGRELLQLLFYITEGDNTLDAGRTEEALNYYRQAAKIRPNNPEIYAKLGYAFAKVGKFSDAYRYFKDGLGDDPQNIFLLNGLARAYRKAHQFEQAEAYYRKALEIDREYVWSLSGLGQIYLHKGDYDQAVEIFENVLRKDASTLPMINLALALACRKEHQRSRELFEKVLSVVNTQLIQSPDNMWLLVKQALCLAGLGQHEEAMRIFTQLARKGVYPSVKSSILDRLAILKRVDENGLIEEMMSLFSG